MTPENWLRVQITLLVFLIIPFLAVVYFGVKLITR